ncbi:MAG: hypothetical protein HKN09_08350 [Saprospiraceae bacterium]|nr:hypothetical protein [Saprospiraceae bacterium]
MRILVAVLIFVFLSCQSDQTTIPKPRVYPRIDFPVKSYAPFSHDACPFVFDKANYVQYQKDSISTLDIAGADCWFDLYSEELNSIFHFSYIRFNDRPTFDALIQDAFEMVDKHNIKANYRSESIIENKDAQLYGILFEIDGPVAAPLQFYVTDSMSHFLRGSLYFNAQVNRDSIAPVYDFLKIDFERMMESFKWES